MHWNAGLAITTAKRNDEHGKLTALIHIQCNHVKQVHGTMKLVYMDAPCQTNADQPQHLTFNSSVPNQPTYCNIRGSNGQRKHVGSGGNDSLATFSHGNHGS
jgi:hypothetical protein